MDENEVAKTKKLNTRDLFFGTMCLLVFLDTATSSSAMGQTAVTWYLIIAVVFFLPSGFIISELASTYPSEGGIYHWVKISLGEKWAQRSSWFYWLNTAVWTGSATVFVMDIASNILGMIFGIQISFPVFLLFSIALIWVYVFVSSRPLGQSTIITNLGGLIAIVIVVLLVICAAFYLVSNNGVPANDMSPQAFVPTFHSAIIYFPALVYNLMGLDSISAIAGDNVENPRRDMPRILVTCMGVVVAVLVLFTLSVLVITPVADIDIISGIPNSFLRTFPGITGVVLYVVVGLMFLVSVFAKAPAWMLATSNMAMAAGKNGDLPKAYAVVADNGAPRGALVIQGSVGTGVLVIFGIITIAAGGSGQELFWNLFSFTNIFYLMPYIICFSAFVWLRKHDATTERAFKFPAAQPVAVFFARLGQTLLIVTILLMFWVPGTEFDAVRAIMLAVGMFAGVGVGEFFYRRKLRKSPSE